MLKRLKAEKKRGVFVILVSMVMLVMYPVLIFTVLDFGRVHVMRETLKGRLQSSAVSAATCIDWENTYMGWFTLNLAGDSEWDNAAKALYRCLVENLNPTFTSHATGFRELGTVGGDSTIHRYEGDIGAVTWYAEIYAEEPHVEPSEKELGGGRIPASILADSSARDRVTVRTSNPAIFVIAKRNQKSEFLSILGLGGFAEIVQFSSAELRSSSYADN